MRRDRIQLTNFVREQRKRRGMTQKDLAFAVGVSRQSIISIERGRYVPSLPLALQLAELFECHVDELFRSEETEQDG